MMRRFIFNTLNVRKQYLYSIAAVLIVSMVSFALTEAVGGYRVVAFVLLLTVSILAITFDILPVLLAAALSAFIWDFFFIPPRFTIHVDNTEDSILLVMYFVIALINGVLTYKIRQVEKASRLLASSVRKPWSILSLPFFPSCSLYSNLEQSSSVGFSALL